MLRNASLLLHSPDTNSMCVLFTYVYMELKYRTDIDSALSQSFYNNYYSFSLFQKQYLLTFYEHINYEHGIGIRFLNLI